MQQYKTKTKNVRFEDEELCQLEMCHNLIRRGHPNPEKYIKYNPHMKMITDRLIYYINTKVTSEKNNFD